MTPSGAPPVPNKTSMPESSVQVITAPDTYMEKIAVGPAARGQIDLRESPTWNLERIAKALGKQVNEVTAVILDRDRHTALINEVRQAGARIRLIGDGDVSGAVMTCKPDSGIDVLFGIGGAPEGVIAAAAMRCVGGELQGRLRFRNDEERARAGDVARRVSVSSSVTCSPGSTWSARVSGW